MLVLTEHITGGKPRRSLGFIVKVKNARICRLEVSVARMQMLKWLAFDLKVNYPLIDDAYDWDGMNVKRSFATGRNRHLLDLDRGYSLLGRDMRCEKRFPDNVGLSPNSHRRRRSCK